MFKHFPGITTLYGCMILELSFGDPRGLELDLVIFQSVTRCLNINHMEDTSENWLPYEESKWHVDTDGRNSHTQQLTRTTIKHSA